MCSVTVVPTCTIHTHKELCNIYWNCPTVYWNILEYTGIYWNILSVWEYTASTYVAHTSRAQLVFVLICPFESYSILVPAGWEVWHVVTTRWLTEEVRKEKNDKPFERTSWSRW